ncbi:alpha/beta hydrolase [Nonomuraea sp. NPDC049158]|uniref:alpha/beta hydrolase n=1 Tax=Nonomuraea sp. NPDC049158 TaxID=3155649 RepID=UPI00340A3AA1
MRLRLFTAALAGAALVTQLAGVASAQSAPSGPSTAIDWAECGTTYKGECATIKVPMDYAKPKGATIDLAIGRLKALDPAKRQGVLFVHPGGPGGSGLNAYIMGRGIPDDSPLRQYFDIVSVDPRGVGRSTPILCGEDVVNETPFTYPANEAEYQNWLAFNAKLSKDCRERTGPLFDHVGTTNVVRDVDSIRAALGERQISFFAISYGTQVGQQYAEMFPKNLRAMAIDSNMDHSITSAYQYMKTTTEDLEGSYQAFAKWCGETAACALHGQDATAVLDDLLAKARAGTLKDPETGAVISDEELRIEVFEPMYRPWTGFFPLAERLKALAAGQAAEQAADKPVASESAEAKTTARASAEASTSAAEGVNYAYPAIWCSDWKWNVSGFAELDAYKRRLKAIAPHTELSPFWTDVMTCLNWQGKTSNPQHRLRISGTPPILVVKAKDDVATPAAWNYAAARQIPRSVVLEYDGVGHGQFRNSTCARDYIEKYLINRTMPAAGTHCATQFPTEPPATALSPQDSPLSITGRPIH